MEKLVCIILVNYNTYSDTMECVNSLINIEYSNYKIILIDNHSNDSDTILHDEFLNKYCNVIVSEVNGGFSYGNNLGITFAMQYNPDYLLLLNNDTIVKPDFLKNLVMTAEHNYRDCGLVSGKICYYSRPDCINFRGGMFNWESGQAYYVNVENITEPVKKIEFATGCMWLIPRNTINKVGLLNEEFFMYSEDTDYCLRIIKNNLCIYYCDSAEIYHKISASSGESSPFQQYYMQRNKLYIIKEYSRNKIYAYGNQLWISMKGVLKRRLYLFVTIRAWFDFVRGIKGRVKKY